MTGLGLVPVGTSQNHQRALPCPPPSTVLEWLPSRGQHCRPGCRSQRRRDTFVLNSWSTWVSAIWATETVILGHRNHVSTDGARETCWLPTRSKTVDDLQQISSNRTVPYLFIPHPNKTFLLLLQAVLELTEQICLGQMRLNVVCVICLYIYMGWRKICNNDLLRYIFIYLLQVYISVVITSFVVCVSGDKIKCDSTLKDRFHFVSHEWLSTWRDSNKTMVMHISCICWVQTDAHVSSWIKRVLWIFSPVHRVECWPQGNKVEWEKYFPPPHRLTIA